MRFGSQKLFSTQGKARYNKYSTQSSLSQGALVPYGLLLPLGKVAILMHHHGSEFIYIKNR